ncbi:lysosomal acid glucosylceramidase-like [Oppia nitens]|uniref:lysosomal acid glucosylceramidase-like n=1 Tax=Oppia nitens TaxID=1686743 RepID=UPI0023DAE9CD|nr:lysosomal acid glucosylceramidase-like [Oppia nitens]
MLYQLILSFSLLLLAESRQPCAKRDLGNGNIVCVCNATYCDTLDPWKRRTPVGVVTVYETNRDGDRLAETKLKFADNIDIDSTDSANDVVVVDQTVTIDRNKRGQKIIGFGASMTDSTGFNLRSLPESAQQHLIDDYFSANGLEFNLVRVPIGGSDFSTHAYSYDDLMTDDFDLNHFNLTADDHNYKIPYIKLAQKVSPYKIKLFGSPWAPPAWMKNNSQLIHGGYLIGEPGGKYYKTFANYFIKFLDAYKSNGIDIWGLTIENEPKAGNSKTYGFNCLGFTPELQRDFIKKDLGPALHAAGYGTDRLALMIFDDQRTQLFRWSSVILADKDAAKYVTGIAVHWYEDKDTNVGELDRTQAIDPTKYIINTESSNCCHDLGNWVNAEAYAKSIIIDLNHQVRGYVGWNMALDLLGGPRWCGGKADAPVAVDAAQHEYYKQPSFYSLGHFSKFLAPDSEKLAINEDKPLENVWSTAFERPDGAVVVIVFNQSADTVKFTIKEAINRWVTHTLRPHSIQTYIYYNN